jgi:uncharacterized FAD-dependent dehydrogenase
MALIDIIVIGGGPAGLAAAYACNAHGLSTLLIERGKIAEARQRDNRHDITAGIGGAGLYSDGKFSFYPSATQLWRLRPEAILREAYEWYSNLLRAFDFDCPPLPQIHPEIAPRKGSAQFFSKDYLSKYLTFDERARLISTLTEPIQQRMRTDLEVVDITPNETHVTLIGRDTNGQLHSFSAQIGVVVASGRFGSLMLRNQFPREKFSFKRLEVGVRLEQPAEKFFLRNSPTIDPKRIWYDDGIAAEWRTFCCCREGEVICSRSDNILSVSGRADGPRTSRSSVGVHVRVLDESTAARAWAYLRPQLDKLTEPITEPLSTFLSNAHSEIGIVLGPDISSLLRRGTEELLVHFPSASVDARLHAPTLEGVGYYPNLDEHLAFGSDRIMVAGDATGLFRGITAALVSGYFCGVCLARKTEAER